jgi:hypothetical protein
VARSGSAWARAIVIVALLGGSACSARRTPEEQAAVRAQDACIAALEPVSKSRRPAPENLADAVVDAEAAAGVDQRWAPLRARVLEFRERTDSSESLDALVNECGRVNQIVKEKRSGTTSLG